MFTRRKFLTVGTYALVLARARLSTPSSAVIDAQAEQTLEFESRHLKVLAGVMDVIIPAADGMPSATAAGAVSYLANLCRQYPTIQTELRRFLDSVNRESVAKFHTEFDSRSENQRIHVLKSLEDQAATAFSAFVAYVYEAYYTRPQVLGLITCREQLEKPDELELLLAPVRAMKPSTREER